MSGLRVDKSSNRRGAGCGLTEGFNLVGGIGNFLDNKLALAECAGVSQYRTKNEQELYIFITSPPGCRWRSRQNLPTNLE